MKRQNSILMMYLFSLLIKNLNHLWQLHIKMLLWIYRHLLICMKQMNIHSGKRHSLIGQKAFNSKGPYLFQIVSRSTDIVGSISETEKIRLLLRIRNVANCIEYLNTCPDSVKDVFRKSSKRCYNRPCNKGVAYEYEGKSYWRCGCCAPAFKLKPKVQDIPHYIKLVELGSKK